MAREAPDRYEPLPALPDLPAWLWRRTSRGVRIGLAVCAVLFVGILVALAVAGSGANRDARERAAREDAARQARVARTLAAEQRPVLDRVTPPGDDLAARAGMLEAISAAILADARARVVRGALNGPIRRVSCQPFPNQSRPADRDPSRRRGRYSCVAVTAAFEGGVIGHPYRVIADFRSGRYGYCKITGRAGPERHRPVTIPAACGGDDFDGG